MKPATHTLQDLFGAPVRYIVPLYQRPYVWKQDSHWRPLWEDVADLVERYADPATGAPSHFMGAVVLDQEETTPGEATVRLVIDGQQRLTTLQLLLSAAAEEADRASAERDGRLLRRLTHNDPDLTAGDARFKVWPTNANQAAFRAVMIADGGDVGVDDPSNSIHEAHAYFRKAIRDWSTDGAPDAPELVGRFGTLRIALTDLLYVVSINLERGDNPQVIFETLNARGTPLLAMDLVKNAVFYRAFQAGAPTEELHANTWHPELGRAYWRDERRQGRLNRPRAELFLMHWLTMKLGRPVSATQLFSEFRSEILAKTPTHEIGRLVRELCHDAAVMRSFDDQAAGSVEQQFFAHLAVLDTTTVLPVVLLLFRSSEVPADRRSRALRAIESWLVRRMLAGLTAKNYNKIGVDLLRAATDDLGHADERIIAELASSGADTQLWPGDREMARILVTRRLYGWIARPRVVMVLAAVEIARRRASVKTESLLALPAKLTIEHVMPQKWRENWSITADDPARELELAGARDAALHQLGNLTLTTGPLNSSLSNAAWSSKRTGIRDHSLLLLNSELSTVPEWDLDAINRRGFSLASEICRIWPSAAEFGVPEEAEPARSLEAILAGEAAAVGPRPSRRAQIGRGSLRALLSAGYLEVGETLHAARRSATEIAIVLEDGRVGCGEEIFDTLSPAAARVSGRWGVNGWTFWRVRRGAEFVSLAELRDRLAAPAAAADADTTSDACV
jgi:hypothetical protein